MDRLATAEDKIADIRCQGRVAHGLVTPIRLILTNLLKHRAHVSLDAS